MSNLAGLYDNFVSRLNVDRAARFDGTERDMHDWMRDDAGLEIITARTWISEFISAYQHSRTTQINELCSEYFMAVIDGLVRMCLSGDSYDSSVNAMSAHHGYPPPRGCLIYICRLLDLTACFHKALFLTINNLLAHICLALSPLIFNWVRIFSRVIACPRNYRSEASNDIQ